MVWTNSGLLDNEMGKRSSLYSMKRPTRVLLAFANATRADYYVFPEANPRPV